MAEERVPFRAFLIGEDGERREVTDRSAVTMPSGVEDIRAAMNVAMDALRAYTSRSEPES